MNTSLTELDAIPTMPKIPGYLHWVAEILVVINLSTVNGKGLKNWPQP